MRKLQIVYVKEEADGYVTLKREELERALETSYDDGWWDSVYSHTEERNIPQTWRPMINLDGGPTSHNFTTMDSKLNVTVDPDKIDEFKSEWR